MNIQIDAIEETYSLDTKQIKSCLVVTLPSGRTLKIPVDAQEIEAIMQANNPETVEFKDPEPEHYVPQLTQTEPQEDQSNSIDWLTVSDEIIPPAVKKEMQTRGYPRIMPVQEIATVARQIIGELQQATQTAKTSAPTKNNSFIQRRIDTDEAGNPLVEQNAQQDPGEIFDEETGAQSI